MTGEALNRKYHELCGWTLAQHQWGGVICLHWMPPGNTEIVPPCRQARDRQEASRQYLPALHLNANLAIAEARKVFKEWSLKTFESHCFFVPRIEPPILACRGDGEHGACEAILKALIAAKDPQ
jgi:hypothetical protein